MSDNFWLTVANSFGLAMFLGVGVVLLMVYMLRKRVSPGSRGDGLLVAPKAPVPGLSGQTLDVKAIDMVLKSDEQAILAMLNQSTLPDFVSGSDITSTIDARLDVAEAQLGLPPLTDQERPS